ncbi:MAG: hypothetical protein IKB99_00215 [Lentisphaeria bacterium]|nr:hypothetical protein [Lentisphaeria bacterium]
MKKHFRNNSQSGQVLLTGIVMMSLLLLIIIYAFDVHNVIRAKLKVDIAQQSAAMTGALWQKESLNLLGEINLLKASALLLEGPDNWKTPLPDREKEEEACRKEIQNRIDLLTEMQTRVSFIGPLIGFAAAQQAAKANGLTRIPKALDDYIKKIPDKPLTINNYTWREPYTALVSSINSSGIAVFPNARTIGMPIARPSQLANARFYTEIMKAANAIAANDPPKKHYWNLLCPILRSMDDKDFQGKWWHIDYQENRFPEESEIFTVGVEFVSGVDDEKYSYFLTAANRLKNNLEFYAGPGSLPGQMKWCIYDNWWLPEYYKARYPEYESSHYNYWYKNGALRKEMKPGYIYEGPAAYTEGYADVRAKINVRPSTRPYYNSIAEKSAREAIRDKENPILRKSARTTTRVGTRRGRADDSDYSTNYRPGSIAKVLGSFDAETPPIAIDMILPVFKRVSPVPTFMPIPYGFQVLKPGESKLEIFLKWLKDQEDLNGVPPEGTEEFLEALRFLVYGVKARAEGKGDKADCVHSNHISGRALRYYGYNHKFNRAAFENEFRDRLWEWKKVRDKRVFQQTVLDGPGYLQEPRLFHTTPYISHYRKLLGPNEKKRFDDSTIEIDKEGNCYEVLKKPLLIRNNTVYRIDPDTQKVALPNQINTGGTAYRIYIDTKVGTSAYYVIDSRGRIVLNGEPDPTKLYNQYFREPGKCTCEGECKCKSVWNPGHYDGVKGPTRL